MQTDPSGSGSQAQIAAGRGEYESFQIVVHAPASGLSSVNVTVTDLTGPNGALIPKTSFMLYREHYVSVSPSSPNWGGSNQPQGAGTYPDALVPFVDPATGLAPVGASITATPFNVAGNQNQPVWVDVLVPHGIPAGQYSGSYTVTSSQGNATGGISLTVWNFDMPTVPSLKSSFLFWNGEGVAAQQEILRHHIMPMKTDPLTQSSLVNGFGLGASGMGFWSGADQSTCSMNAAPSVSQIQAVVAQQQPSLLKYDYSADEIGACASLYGPLKQWGYAMHQAGVKNLVTMSPDPNLYDDGSGTNHSAVDIWVMLPAMYDASVSQVNYVKSKGDLAWSYNALVQDSYSPKWLIDFAPINFRIHPGFISQSLGLTGLLYWKLDDWSADPWHQVNNTGKFSSANYPGDGMLVYPGTQAGIQGVAPSMRLKWLRDGIEDYEYVNILKNMGQGAWAMQMAQSVGASWSNWTQNPSSLESVRQQLGAKIDALNGGGATSTPASTLGSPANPSPANGAAAVATSASLAWSAASGATSYDVYFGTSATPPLVTNTTSTGYGPGSLAINTTYYWKIVAKNSTTSASSAVWSFTTDAPATTTAAPATPVNPNPANGASGVSSTATLSWPAVANATSYDVYFGTTSTPNLITNVTGTSYSPGSLNTNSTYYWAVVAKGPGGAASSAIWSFATAWTATAQSPLAPVNPSPANGASGVSSTVALSWPAVANATSYDVYFGTTSTPNLITNITGTSYSPGSLNPGVTYYWAVVAKGPGGTASSAIWSFTTGAAAATQVPATPANPNPPSGSAGVSTAPTLSWPAVANATSYDFYFGTTSTPNLITNMTGTSYSPGTLNAGATYYWAVVAKSNSGSNSSPIWSFTTSGAATVQGPAAPSGSNPASGSSGVSIAPVLSWTPVSGATSYDLYFGTTGTPNLVTSVAGTSYSPGTLNYSSTYYWQVVAKNSAGSASSAVWWFTTASAPVVVAPAGGGTAVTGTLSPLNGAMNTPITAALSWPANGKAYSYDVYLGTSSSPGFLASSTSTSLNPGILANGTTYYWRVVARTSNGSSESGLWSFTTAAGAPAPAVVNTPPVDVSASLVAGAGATQTFTFVYSDVNGASNIAGAGAMINTAYAGTNACWFYYDNKANTISLADDAASSWQAIPLNSGLLQNSQCMLRQANVSASGNTLTLTVTLTFKRTFGGLKNVYMYSQDTAGLNSGYPLMATWRISL